MNSKLLNYIYPNLPKCQIMFHQKSSSHDFNKKNFGYGSNRRKKTFPDGWCLSQNHGGKLSLLSCLHRRWPEKGTPSAVLHTTSIPLPWKVRPRLLEKVQIKTHISGSYVSNQMQYGISLVCNWMWRCSKILYFVQQQQTL